MQPRDLIPVGIAIASLIVVPALVAVGKRLTAAWREARQARLARLFIQREELEQFRQAQQDRLAKVFVAREEVEMQFDTLNRNQAKQHEENQQFLDTIRAEALQREGRVMQKIDDVQRNTRSDVISVHARIDKLFELLTRGNG